MSVARLRARIERATAQAAEAGLAGLLVTPGSDLAYLTGYDPLPLERMTLLVLVPDRDPVLLVPALERPAALTAPGAEAVEVVGWAEGDDPYAAAGPLLSSGRLAISDQAWAAHVLGLQRVAPEASFTTIGAALPLLRAVKDEDELARLRAVGAAADAAFVDIVGVRFEGRSELEVAADLAEALRAHGHGTVDFTIVGSGPNGASPHHDAGERTIGAGEAVVLDFGGHMAGYCSDTTRTVSVGEPSDELRRVHEIVRAAQHAGVDAVRPGVACEAVDAAARAVIEDAGYGQRFIHRTGHGIGMDVHEPPYIVSGNPTPLEPGMTFSVEPGIYLPDRFGVRIEDIVAVTPDGAERLNRSPRELTIVA
ncbi:MAG TPA: Xaa-Pro peptidase family protein [Actinomycetota bacterium]|nr:Xaa-Pro peptidase family protein [Actinomycetota bacterium]